MRRVWRPIFLIAITVTLAGCGSAPRTEPTRVAEVLTSTPAALSTTPPAPSPTLVSTATVAPTATVPIVQATATEPLPTPTPLEPTPTPLEPTPTPISPTPTTPGVSALTEFQDPAELWTVQYPADVLKTEELNQDITLFISADRGTVAAVDTYVAEGDEYGNTGEDLRNRARETLERIYGRPVNETDILSDPEGNWATGITFTTNAGSKGEAVFMQPGFRQGDRRVYGFVYGYKAASEETMLPLLQAMRASFQETAQTGAPPLLFVQDDAILEQRGTGPAERIASVPELGQVAAAASFGDVMLILDERGLHRVLLGDGSSQLLHQFSGPVRFGQILVSGELAVVAATVDDADAQFSYRTHLGLYDHIVDSFAMIPGTPELEQYTALQPLGQTTNGNGIYVLPRGQDPSFTRVVVVGTETGEIVRNLAISGEGAIALSPDRETIVTIDRVIDDPASFVAKFYDLDGENPEPRSMPLPPELGNAASLWSTDNQALYFLNNQSPETPATNPLWRLDVATGESMQVAVLDQVDQLVAISPDGRWLLARASTEGVGAIVDLEAGTSTTITFAPEAFAAGWR